MYLTTLNIKVLLILALLGERTDHGVIGTTVHILHLLPCALLGDVTVHLTSRTGWYMVSVIIILTQHSLPHSTQYPALVSHSLVFTQNLPSSPQQTWSAMVSISQ